MGRSEEIHRQVADLIDIGVTAVVRAAVGVGSVGTRSNRRGRRSRPPQRPGLLSEKVGDPLTVSLAFSRLPKLQPQLGWS